MADTLPGFFRSALNFINNQGIPAVSRVVNATSNVVAGMTGEHSMVGQVIEVGREKVKIHSLLAEGGFALVFSCQNQEGHWMALKRQIATDSQSASAIKQEIRFAKELSDHPAIMRFIAASHSKSPDGRLEFYMLSELCSGGPLIDVMQRTRLKPDQILKIFYALCCAVHHMHDRNPPITHRDLKIENLLFDSTGHIKLCDFGSATTDIFRPDDSWTLSQRTHLEEEMQRFTTPMYRAPEILDTYQNHPIGPSQDVWALGCILCYLCNGQHPFVDSAKLAIVNAKYKLPDEPAFQVFCPIIKSLLQPDPYSRPTIRDVCDILEDIAASMGIRPTDPVIGLTSSSSESTQETQATPISSVKPPTSQSYHPPVPPQPKVAPNRIHPGQASPAPPRPPPPRSATQQQKPPPRTSSIKQSEEDRIRQNEMEQAMKAEEEYRRAMAKEEEYRRDLAAQHQALKDAEQRRTGLGHPHSTRHQIVDNDPFAIFDSRPQPSASSANLRPLNDNLLGDWPCDYSSIHRNSSAPSLEDNDGKKFDPFADFLANSTTQEPEKSVNTQAKSANNSGRSTPGNVQRFAVPSQDRRNFESFFNAGTGISSKVEESAFDDLLSSQGFSSAAKNAQRSLASIKREEEVKIMDPITLKIRDWTNGKERNIRALLGSLNEVLWEEAIYVPPSVHELLSDANVKKHYRKAIIVIHPDKQQGQPHHELAIAIFKEIQLAWEKFENDKA